MYVYRTRLFQSSDGARSCTPFTQASIAMVLKYGHFTGVTPHTFISRCNKCEIL